MALPRASYDPGAPPAALPLSAAVHVVAHHAQCAVCFRTKRSAALSADGAPASAAAILDNLLPERCAGGRQRCAQRTPEQQFAMR